MVLSCLFLCRGYDPIKFLFLVPAVTIVLTGPALIALYQTIDQLYQEKDVPVWQRYSRAFLANIKRGIVLEGIIVGYVAVTAAIIYGLMGITTYLGVLAVILSSLAGLFLTVFVLLFCLFSSTVKQTAHENCLCGVEQYRQCDYLASDSCIRISIAE